MRPHILAAWANEAAPIVIARYKNSKTVPTFIYQGSSGIAVVTALTQAIVRLDSALHFATAMVRKENENSHGRAVESYNLVSTSKQKLALIFVDDFIATGTTLLRVYNTINLPVNTKPFWSPWHNKTAPRREYRMLLAKIEHNKVRLQMIPKHLKVQIQTPPL